FYLAEFVERHSAAVLRGDAEINPLIDINSAIIRGLNGQVPV
ncbi:MAG: flagellar biosynthesis regulator FlhF, partial [Loktanella sp.]|nr:flagellar biosynthesis regulator FlhF [Loktanella sp.]